jgi:DMSO reductase anchor subunit
MCHGRLASGEAPACVQGCPNEAISIRIVAHGEREGQLLCLAADGMPLSNITRPTTRYVSRRAKPDHLVAADHHRVEPADAHTPLAVMLVAAQLSFGLLLTDRLASALGGGALHGVHPIAALAAAGVALAGQAAATLHLGRPQYAFRAFLGWRTSWMSREILAFGAYAGAIVTFAASLWAPRLAGHFGVPLTLPAVLPFATGLAALATGLLGTACSIMIYADTHRAFWSLRRTAGRFLGTTAVLGPAALWLCATLAFASGIASDERGTGTIPFLALATFIATIAKLTGEVRGLRHRHDATFSTLARSASLIVGPLRRIWRCRLALGVVGGLALPALAIGLSLEAKGGAAVGGLALLCLVTGEFLERHLFFRAVASRAMPGQT